MKDHTILLVDDEASILRSLERLFRGESYKTITCTDAKTALEVLERERVDVIISDQRMPGMTGTELLTIVRHKYPEIIRILFSGYLEIESLISAINDASIRKFISKPWDGDEIIQLLEMVVQQKEEVFAHINEVIHDIQADHGVPSSLVVYKGEEMVLKMNWPEKD